MLLTVHPQTSRRKDRRNGGLCSEFGCAENVGDNAYRCDTHAEGHATKTREVYAARRRAGLCTKCGEPSERWACKECR